MITERMIQDLHAAFSRRDWHAAEVAGAKIRDAEFEMRAAAFRQEQASKHQEEPVRWLHTLHMEGGQINEVVTAAPTNGFGVPGKDYSEEYTVTSEPLFKRAAPQPGAWQSIDTAPKDGSSILVDVDGASIARWNDDRHNSKPRPYWKIAGFGSPRSTRDREKPPTLWRPLPTP